VRNRHRRSRLQSSTIRYRSPVYYLFSSRCFQSEWRQIDPQRSARLRCRGRLDPRRKRLTDQWQSNVDFAKLKRCQHASRYSQKYGRPRSLGHRCQWVRRVFATELRHAGSVLAYGWRTVRVECRNCWQSPCLASFPLFLTPYDGLPIRIEDQISS
jgi:hypothetical protein